MRKGSILQIPFSLQLFEVIELPNEQIDWATDCVPFAGPEDALPTGLSYIANPNVKYEDLIEPGSVVKLKSGGILDLKVNEETYQALINVYGPRAILIGTATGERLTRVEWYNTKGQTDGLKLAIIKHCNKEILGPGIHIPK